MRKRTPWKTGITAAALAAILVQASVPALAADAQTSVVSAPSVNYGLTSDIRAALKGVSVESTAQGLQLAAVVRLYNGGTVQNRVPEHELRVRQADGLTYTLKPSATNKTALQPKEIGELVYMATVDSKAEFKPADLSLVNVNEYTYPKQETTLLTLPAADQVWYGAGSENGRQRESLAWGTTFRIPGLNSELVYTPVGLSKQSTAQGTADVVTLLVENPGVGKETVPSFRIDGRAAAKTYTGAFTDKQPVVVEAGAKAYVHIAIPYENGSALTELFVMTTDTFTQAGNPATQVAIDTGRLKLALPDGGQADRLPDAYTLGTPIAFDPLTKVVDAQTEVSLMELHLHENPDEGYQTVVGKFKITNKGSIPAALPAFQTQLVSGTGATYAGSRQSNVAETLNPGLSYVISYSFNVPQSEKGDALTLKLLDAQTASPYVSTAASLATSVQQETTEERLDLYPFDVRLNYYTISAATTGAQTIAYTYKVLLDLDIAQAEDVVADANSSKLRFEVVDTLGRILGSTDGVFTGTNKLVSGRQTLTFANIKSEQLEFPVTVNVYEVIQTPGGEAKRLLKTLR
ncbi:hypothetical protein P9314_24530 [Paenibacillus validus]|uniref:hypothetical protein n=1 Tax=Paenibacillus validus TaxID=44253 RepID=UPI000FDC2196|nr:hypothetical protein [Paenibacillus validus]MED4603797.1 hypothetical protein [Paenibacillus validus]MED4609350.1 hypothetical protein [Paenibacillus validus]